MPIGKMMIAAGIVLITLGGIITLFGKLPGDVLFKKGNTTFYFPVMTSIIASMILSVIFYLIGKIR